jgi:GNAT superfamily N-acetyltransferase
MEGILMIREIIETDLMSLLKLYTNLHDKELPEENENLLSTWKHICEDENHHIIVAEEEGNIVSSCVLIIIPNLTHNQRPYGIIENVVTHESYRNKGYATACLNYAKDIASNNNCYKIMLMTGSKKDSTLKFYENAGYNRIDKTGFIHWL